MKKIVITYDHRFGYDVYVVDLESEEARQRAARVVESETSFGGDAYEQDEDVEWFVEKLMLDFEPDRDEFLGFQDVENITYRL